MPLSGFLILGGATLAQTFLDYMEERLTRSKAYQLSRGKRFDLSLVEYLALHSHRQLDTLERHFEAGTLHHFLRCKWGYVLTWRSKTDFEGGILCAGTAIVVTREESRRRTYLKKGERQSDDTRAKIAASKRGAKHSDDHIEKRTAPQRGVKRGPMTEEHKAAIREGRARQIAAKAPQPSPVTITPEEAARLISKRVRALSIRSRQTPMKFRAIEVRKTPESVALAGELISVAGGENCPPPAIAS